MSPLDLLIYMLAFAAGLCVNGFVVLILAIAYGSHKQTQEVKHAHRVL